jgi:hypothetical protein
MSDLWEALKTPSFMLAIYVLGRVSVAEWTYVFGFFVVVVLLGFVENRSRRIRAEKYRAEMRKEMETKEREYQRQIAKIYAEEENDL